MTTLPDDLEAALSRYMADHAMNRDDAIASILSQVLGVPSDRSGEKAGETELRETVQYPEFLEDASGGSGG